MQVQSNRKNVDGSTDLTYYSSPLDAVRKIIKSDGILGLYTGIFGGLVGVASTNFAYFYWYTFVRDAYKRRQKVDGPLSTAMELVLGAIAGALAQIFTIPVSVCTTRQQTQLGKDQKGLIDTAKEVISEDGITGLWRGLKPSLVLVVNPAITYGLFERFKEVMYPGTARLLDPPPYARGALHPGRAAAARGRRDVRRLPHLSRPAGLDASDQSASGVFALDPGNRTPAAAGEPPVRGARRGGHARRVHRLLVFGGGAATSTDLIQAFDLRTGRALGGGAPAEAIVGSVAPDSETPRTWSAASTA